MAMRSARWGMGVLALAMIGAGIEPAIAQRPEIHQSGQTEFGSNLAVGGYDAVAYHAQALAVAGKPMYRVSWKDAEWRFSSAENRDLFVKVPETYAPQFGGYCAFTVAYGSTAPGNPKVFTLVDGKLYLNLNTSVQATWVQDQQSLIKRAEINWPKLLK